MSYSDVLNSLKLHGGALNQTASDWANIGNNMQSQFRNTTQQSQGVNPWSSEAYVPRTYRDIYSEYSPVVDPRSAFSEYKPYSGDNLLMQGTKGLTYAKGAQQFQPFMTDIAKTLNPRLGDDFGIKGLGPAAMLYGATQNQNPYDYTPTEKWGTIGSTALAARSIAPALGLTGASATAAGLTPILGMHPLALIGGLILGGIFSKKKKRAAATANLKAIEEMETAQTEQYEDRSQKLQDMRDDMLSQQTSQLWQQDASRYANQYGGNYSNRYADEGMKFSPKELNKIAKSGRNGDTMLAHINPQEAALLKVLGGSGTKNPYTNLPEYGYFRNVVTGFGDVATSTLQTVADPLLELGKPIAEGVHDKLDPIMRGIRDVAVEPAMKGFTNISKGIIDATGAGLRGIPEVIATGFDLLRPFLFPGDSYTPGGGVSQTPQEPLRESVKKKLSNAQTANIKFSKAGLTNLSKENKAKYKPGDWVGDKPSPYITSNVEEELDVMAHGGKMDVIAEFTGNELIVNDQAKVEQGLASGNYAMAASPIRQAMKNKQLTPGQESHGGNPMPVDSEGNIYAGGGKLKFKVNKGAGVYDHATDQFKPTMTDREIAMVAQSNINKWESNGMA